MHCVVPERDGALRADFWTAGGAPLPCLSHAIRSGRSL